MFEAVDGLMHEQSCTWWAPSAAQDKKGRSTAGAPSAGSVKTGQVSGTFTMVSPKKRAVLARARPPVL